MQEYTADVLDLMARVYEQACDLLAARQVGSSANLEAARSSLADAIIEAVDNGLRNEDLLIATALAKLKQGPQ